MNANFIYSFLFLWIARQDIEVNGKDESRPVTLVICENKKTTIQCSEKEVNIIQVFYGRKDQSICPDSRNKNTNCSTNGVRSKVMRICFNKDKCEVEAKTSIFGDACPETSKYLSIKYQCQDYPKHLVICEGYKKTLKCPSNHHVDIIVAFYGRRNNVTCFRGRDSNTRCNARGVKSKLSEICKGRTVCDVDSNSSVFGDPCPRTSKYLQLQYRCIPVHVVNSRQPPSTVAKPRKKLAIICDQEKKPLRCLKAYGGVIEVLKATYGRTNVHKCVDRTVGTSLCKPVNVLSIVKKKCDNKNVCHISVPNKHFGDPCSNTTKYAKIVYHCRKVCTSKQFECSIDKSCIDITHRCDNVKNCADASDEKGCHPKTLITTTEEPFNPEPSTSKNNVIICIDDDNTLSCDKEHNTVISVTRASYGRNSIRKCPEGNIGTTSCGPKNILQMVKQQCNGKHLCRVTEPDEDPCPGTTKYFKISYDCVKGS